MLTNLDTIDLAFDLEEFFEASHDLICIAGFDGYFKKINSAVSRTLGYTMEELYARPIEYFMHDEDRVFTVRKRDCIKNGQPLINFENRYVTSKGEVVWLLWTSVPVQDCSAVFAIAKDITYRKKLDEYRRIAAILNKVYLDKHAIRKPSQEPGIQHTHVDELVPQLSPADHAWLEDFERRVKLSVGKRDISVSMLSQEMAMSERQLFRRIKSITGFSPIKYIRVIRLHIAKEAIESGKFRTLAELSNVAGFETPAYFNRLFKEVYGFDAGESLKSRGTTHEALVNEGAEEFYLRTANSDKVRI